MKKTIPFVLLVSAACTNSGYDGFDDGPAIAPTVSQSAGTALGAISFDEGADTLAITVNGADFATLAARDGQGNATFDGYFFGIGNLIHGFRATSDSGASQVLLVVEDNRDAVVISQIARLTDTVVPVSGEVTYTGGYVGVMTKSNEASDRAVTGQVRLVASFDAGDVSGSIANRRLVFADSLELPLANDQTNITFEVGTLSTDGTFSGVTEEATFAIPDGTRSGTYEGSGTYNGLITGATGDEAVGSVVMEYERVSGFNTTYTETGVFILDAE